MASRLSFWLKDSCPSRFSRGPAWHGGLRESALVLRGLSSAYCPSHYLAWQTSLRKEIVIIWHTLQKASSEKEPGSTLLFFWFNSRVFESQIWIIFFCAKEDSFRGVYISHESERNHFYMLGTPFLDESDDVSASICEWSRTVRMTFLHFFRRQGLVIPPLALWRYAATGLKLLHLPRPAD